MTNIDTIREAHYQVKFERISELMFQKGVPQEAFDLLSDIHPTRIRKEALSTIDPDATNPCKGCIPPSRDFCLTLPKCPKPDTSHDDAIRRECANRLEAWWRDEDTCIGMLLEENIVALRAAILGTEPTRVNDERQIATDALSEACAAIKRFRDLDPTEGSYLQVIDEARDIFEIKSCDNCTHRLGWTRPKPGREKACKSCDDNYSSWVLKGTEPAREES